MHTLIVAIHAIVIFHSRSSAISLSVELRGRLHLYPAQNFSLRADSISRRHASKHLGIELVISSLQRSIGSAAHRRGWRVSSRRDERRGPSSGLENEAKAVLASVLKVAVVVLCGSPEVLGGVAVSGESSG